MAFSIEFHATVAEIGNFVAEWMHMDGHVYAAAVNYQPFHAFAFLPEEAEEVVSRQDVRRIIFCAREIDCDASGNGQLLEKNPGALVLDIGRQAPRGIEESRLSTMDASATWRKIASSLRKRTKAGMMGVHEGTGARAVYKNHRYTNGAIEAMAAGTHLRQFSQSLVILIPVE